MSSSSKLGIRSFFQYPLLLLLLGPPVIRVELREASASASGAFDAWVLLQVAFYAVLGVRSVWYLHRTRQRRQVRGFWTFVKMSVALSVLLILSSAYSPEPKLTFAYGILFLCGQLIVFQFVAQASCEDVPLLALMAKARTIAIGLAVLVGAVALVSIRAAGGVYIPEAGFRILGGSVAPMPVLGQVIFAVSFYFMLFKLEPFRKSLFCLAVGIAVLAIAQTRSTYIVVVLAFAYVLCMWMKTSKSARLQFFAIIFLLPVLIGAGVSALGGDRVYQVLTRGQSEEGLKTLSGRTYVNDFVLHTVAQSPQGIGYVAGFRSRFMALRDSSAPLDPTRIGNAHNMYFEVLAGAGWLALATFIALLALIARHALQKRTPDFMRTARWHVRNLAWILFLSMLVLGLFSSEFVLPARACFGYFWFAVGMIMSVSLAHRREVAYRRQMILGMAVPVGQAGEQSA
jgi:hypothetical protein